VPRAVLPDLAQGEVELLLGERPSRGKPVDAGLEDLVGDEGPMPFIVAARA
jgi:hypothetical protein